MKIASYNYSIKTESLDIFISGCKGPHCKECHNPELWDFNIGTNYKEVIDKITSRIIEFEPIINKILIMGGEPLDQNIHHLYNFLEELNKLKKPIYLFTNRNLEEISDLIKMSVDYIKCGRYEIDKRNINIQYEIELQSSNQIIYKKGIDY